ncbi:MAG TPA: aminodeoxychorismate lyase [Xanthomonadaceae bacterium]|nr:aminodeoxychorismate lyase [Xanthomonadaceae bacterium]
MITRIYSGEQRIDVLDPCDRGIAYGDGVFETILIDRGTPVWWDAHLARLQHGCATLGIAAPDPVFLRRESDAVVAVCAHGVLKLIVTRGVGERSYALSSHVPPTIVLSLSSAPPSAAREGLRVRWCETPLAIQPRLARIKHLNRLEQVLARAEWNDADPDKPAIHEGLQCDTAGRVVSATSSNLFVLRDGRWLTPPVDACGIAGVCRGWILDHVAESAEAVLTRGEVESADAIVLCNAVRGILPVAALGSRCWSPHAETIALRQRLAEAEPAFDPAHGSQDSLEDA